MRAPARQARGVAILSVITVLVALLMIAIPFVISMKLSRDRTQSSAARNRAVFEAELVVRAVVSYLTQTHPGVEQAAKAAGRGGAFADDTVDTLPEVVPPPAYRKTLSDLVTSAGWRSLADPRSTIWSWDVRDANALVNPNGAKPELLGNLLGAGSLAEDLDPGANTVSVTDVMPLPAMGLVPFSPEGGWIRIGNEVIQYAAYRDGTFSGCSRGALKDTPLKDNGPAQEHKKGARVIDYTAYKLATHVISAVPGTLTSFDTLEALRSVSTWGGGGILDADKFELLLRHVTVWSRRETAAGFLAGQLVLNPLPEASTSAPGEQLRLRDDVFLAGHTTYLNPNTLVQLTDGKQTDYSVALYPGDEKGGRVGELVTLASHLPDGRKYEGGRAQVAARAPIPLNINTASQAVLAAALAGLRLRGVDSEKDVVTASKAWELAGAIVKSREGDLEVAGEEAARKAGPFRNMKDVTRFFTDMLATNALTQKQVTALVRNAVNPNDAELAFGTTNFCFRTLDVYHVEGRAVVNDVAGNKEAEAAVRSVVEVGADAATVWSLDSQCDFEASLALGAGGKYVETYPFNVAYVTDKNFRVQPRPRAPQMVERQIFPSDERGTDIGDVRLQASRLKLPGGPVLEEHFDTSIYADGWWTPASGAYTKPVTKLLRKDDAQDPWVHPFTVSFWMRPWSQGNWFAFDTGKESDQNRISIYVRDGDNGKELVLRVCDATLEARSAEIVCPLARLGYQPETWYHLQAEVRGCDATMMELYVDGLAVGKRVGVTYLSAALSADQDQVPVVDTDGFELEGALLIGTEIVEYDQKQSDGFAQAHRGARGTRAAEWPSGTAVRRLGYSHPLTLDLKKGGAGLEQLNWERWNYFQLTGVGPEDQVAVTVTFPNGGTASLMFFGVKEASTTFTTGVAPADPSSSVTSQVLADAFHSKGYAVLAVQDFDPAPPGGAGGGGSVTDPNIGGWEVVYYERQGQQFTITRYQKTPNHADSGTQYFAATRVMTPNGEQVWPAYLIPISVLGVGVGRSGIDYLDPTGNPIEKEKLAKHPFDGGGGGNDVYTRPRVAVGASDPKGATEVFTYDALDRQRAAPNVLFVRDLEADLANLARVLRFDDDPKTAEELGVTGPGGTTPTPTPTPVPAPGGSGSSTNPVPGGSVPPGLRTVRPEPFPGALPRLARVAGGGAPAPVPVGEPVPAPVSPAPSPGEGDGSTAAPPAQGGVGPGSGREPPPDNSGGGGSEPTPGTGPGNNQPEPGDRPATDPPTDDPDAGSGGSGNGPVVPSLASLKAVFSFRGTNGTVDMRHPTTPAGDEESLLLPCFRVLRLHDVTGLPVGGPFPGFNDVVTLSTGKEGPQREQVRVRWSHGVPNGGGSSSWLALASFIERDVYEADADADGFLYKSDYRGTTRMMKFPSGEMPDEHGENVVWGRNEVGGGSVVTAFFDEIHVWRHQNAIPMGLVVNGENLTEKEKEITIRAIPPATTLVGVEGHDKDCGAVDIDGEIIVYRGTRSDSPDTLTLERCRRGAMGTLARNHGTGTYARFLPEVWVSYLEGTLNKDAATLPLARTRGWPKEGAARLVADDAVEIIHYTGVTPEGLSMPEALDADPSVRGRGLLRGRFGTETIQHDNDEVVFFQPFRYWDRAMLRRPAQTGGFVGVHDHAESAYAEFGKAARDALFLGVGWTEQLEGRVAVDNGDRGARSAGRSTAKADILCLVRFDQGVPWDTARIVDLREGRAMTPEAKADPRRFLYVVDEPGTDLPDRVVPLGVEASLAEFRVVFVYLRDAYRNQEAVGDDPAELVLENAWKNTPWLRSFHARYANRTAVRSRADVR